MAIDWVASYLQVLLAVTGAALILAFTRLLRGPGLADRVVAFETLSMIGLTMTAIYAAVNHLTVLLDIAIAVALVNFIGTVAFARYIERMLVR